MASAFEKQLLAAIEGRFGRGHWIFAGDVAQSVANKTQFLASLGGDDPDQAVLGLAVTIGVGDIADGPELISLGLPRSDDAMANVAQADHALCQLPPAAQARVDEWDPQGSARVLCDFVLDGGTMANRATYGARRPDWSALEDKLAAEQIWRVAEIEAAPAEVIDLTSPDAADQAVELHRRVATRLGSVWAADNDQGFHGGASGTYWVQNAEAAVAKAAELGADHRLARVMGFLEGPVCSIHGIVFDNYTAALHPCEMMMFRNPETSSFVYGRASTYWDPELAQRVEMRSVARRVGDALRELVDYRGVFTVDGVLTPDGFRPTEVNPRYGGALPQRFPTSDGDETIDLFLLNTMIIEGDLAAIDPEEFEAWAVNALEENRFARGFLWTANSPDHDRTCVITRQSNGTLTATETSGVSHDHDPSAIATVEWGRPSDDPDGEGMAIISFTDQVEVGQALAPVMVEIQTAIDQLWSIGPQTLIPAH